MKRIEELLILHGYAVEFVCIEVTCA